MQDRADWIALRMICGIGNRHYKRLIAHFGNPKKVFAADPEELRAAGGLNAGIAAAIAGYQGNPDVEREIGAMIAHGVHIVTLNCPGYPESLKNIYDPPPFLYVKGDLQQCSDPAIAVVGARSASRYGRQVTEQICRDLAAAGVTIISGMARGIDSCAHRAAISGGGTTIAVLGSGADVVYPPENKSLYESIAGHGAVVSEYRMGTEPNGYNFPARNRIISGLSRGVVVVEAGMKSGSLITANLALEQGRDVFAVPGSIYACTSRGANSLLKRGAKLVESAQDILEELDLQDAGRACMRRQGSEALRDCSPEQQKILQMIRQDPVHIDEIIVHSHIAGSRLSSILLDLELGGLIRQLPGNSFVRC